MSPRYPLLFLAGLLFSTSALAQNEVLRQRDSLFGIREFGVVVNVEKPGQLKAPNLEISSVRDKILQEISDLQITIVNDQTLKKSDRFPILHLHINVMYGAPGVYPYSAELRFYQPVQLVLNSGLGTMASTWNSSFVGVVSADYLASIADESVGLIDVFKNDFIRAN